MHIGLIHGPGIFTKPALRRSDTIDTQITNKGNKLYLIIRFMHSAMYHPSGIYQTELCLALILSRKLSNRRKRWTSDSSAIRVRVLRFKKVMWTSLRWHTIGFEGPSKLWRIYRSVEWGWVKLKAAGLGHVAPEIGAARPLWVKILKGIHLPEYFLAQLTAQREIPKRYM